MFYYLDLGGGYTGVYNCQNPLTIHLWFLHLFLCKQKSQFSNKWSDDNSSSKITLLVIHQSSRHQTKILNTLVWSGSVQILLLWALHYFNWLHLNRKHSFCSSHQRWPKVRQGSGSMLQLLPPLTKLSWTRACPRALRKLRPLFSANERFAEAADLPTRTMLPRVDFSRHLYESNTN